MRLGAPILTPVDSPEAWVAEHKRIGSRAAYWPLEPGGSSEEENAYAAAAREADILIAEVPAWSNLISPNDKERKAAVELNEERLELADRLGARCCVNFAGSRSLTSRYAPHADNFSAETFDLVVDTVRGVIDAVQPRNTHYTLEMMPCVFPDSPDGYLELIRAIDRERFAVHLDVVNVLCSPRRYFGSSAMITECVEKLGPRIRSCHIKDTLMTDAFMTHIDEAPAGQGTLDYGFLLTALEGLGDPDLPLMMECLQSSAECDEAAGYVLRAARSAGVTL